MNSMAATLQRYWRDATSYQKFLYVVAALLLASSAFHLGVLFATRGTLAGDTSWRKPILFGESFGLTTLFISWILTFMPKSKVAGWLLCGTLGLVNFGEVFLVSLQQWRGVPSHFNERTPFDESVFAWMGILIALAGIVILIVTVMTLVSLNAPTSLALSIRVGMVLLLAGQVFGILIIANDGNTFGGAGNMKIPHALAIHGLQALPVLAWLLLFTPWSESRRVKIVSTGMAGYVFLIAISSFQTFTGQAPLALGIFSGALFLAGLVAFGGAYFLTLVGLQQHHRSELSDATV